MVAHISIYRLFKINVHNPRHAKCHRIVLNIVRGSYTALVEIYAMTLATKFEPKVFSRLVLGN